MVYHSKALHKQYMFIYLLHKKFESNYAMIVISLTSVTYLLIIVRPEPFITWTIITIKYCTNLSSETKKFRQHQPVKSKPRKIPSKFIFLFLLRKTLSKCI